MKKRILSAVLAIFLLISVFSSSAMAITPIDTARPSSITLQYTHGGKYFAGLEIRTYRIAEVFADGTYALVGDFAGYPVKIYDVTSQSEWRKIASTLASYAEADGILPTCSAVTDERGIVSFTDILPGMYLTLSVTSTDGGCVTVFETFLTVVPHPSDSGDHDYDVTAFPKCDSYTEETDVEYKVIKLWSGDGSSQGRPDCVVVDILKDGVLHTTKELSSANDWTYSWIADNDGSVWSAVEREVPDGYTVTSVREGNTFIITNSYVVDIPDSPQTGDVAVSWPYALAMFISGGAVVILTIWRKRRDA